ncbi:hypothetical protein [Rhodococcoides yunnanense]|uniref:hypothetical protein n=1 Tax=Rhodococcoides yunnanense TaxID=278209 RepID=UPI001114B260|nr:hypothetical protein [Rhodococcus yunnanensis]
MRRVVTSVLLCSILVAGCSSGNSADDLNNLSDGEAQKVLESMSSDDVDDLIEDAASSGRCEDTDLDQNMPWEDYKAAFASVGDESSEETRSPEIASQIAESLDTNLSEIYAQTPERGQGDYARSSCEAMLKAIYTGETDVVVPQTVLLYAGYTACQAGPAAIQPIDSFDTNAAASPLPQLTAEANLLAANVLEAEHVSLPMTENAFEHLCPQIEHTPVEPDRAEKIAEFRQEVEDVAEELGVCGEIEGGAPKPQRVFVHEGTMACDDAEALITAGLDKIRSESLKTATIDGAECSGVTFGDYDSTDFDFSFACYEHNGTVIGLAAQPQE